MLKLIMFNEAFEKALNRLMYVSSIISVMLWKSPFFKIVTLRSIVEGSGGGGWTTLKFLCPCFESDVKLVPIYSFGQKFILFALRKKPCWKSMTSIT